MKHFGMAQWVDFARALAPEADRAAMQQHLAGGCPECQDTFDFYGKLSAVCQAMTECEVPESVVRFARTISRTQASQSASAPSSAKKALRLPVELIFDSFLAPAPAGLRATWQVGWQALYHAGDCSVDLRIEPDLGSSRAAVIGQISNHAAPELEMADLPVCLKQGKVVVAEARSNRFGEFQMEYEQQGRVQLCIYLEGGSKCIQVPIKRLVPDKRSGTGRINSSGPGGTTRSGLVDN
jgi:hypothetical protein